MIHRLALLSLIAMIILTTLGCEKQRDSVVVEDSSLSQVTWAVMVYAAGNYSGDVLSQPIEGTLSRAISTVRVLERTDAPQIVETFVCISTSETEGNVGIYRVTYSGRIPQVLFDAELIEDLGPVSMADPSTMNSFASAVFNRVASQHYLLALSGDGIGWRGVLGDNARPDGMSLLDLHSSIENIASQLPAGKFDILCLYARNMGTIETIAQLRDHASYIMASPWRLEQPHSLVISEWYQDLSSQPQLTPAELGAYIIDAERLAQDSSTTDYFSTLWESDRFDQVESSFENFAAEWSAVAPDKAADITNLRNEATDEEVYNTNFIDLFRYADMIEASPEFADSTFDVLRTASGQLKSAIDEASVARFGSTKSLRYGGLNLYFPTGEVDTALSLSYANLDISQSAPSWAHVIDSLASRGNSNVTITGQAYWPGREFHDLYFIVDTTVSSQITALYQGVPQWEYLNSTHDTISYSVSFDLQSLDSLNIAQFLLYIDRDDNSDYTAGDSLGFWNNGQGTFSAFTVHRGSVDEDRNILIRFRRP